MGWIGIDLDATLAHWGTKDPHTSYVHYDVLVIGPPILKMVERVKALIAEGKDVRIFTARIGPVTEEDARHQIDKAIERGIPGFERETQVPMSDWMTYQKRMIADWCREHLGQELPITCVKDFHMWELWDDRCKQVSPNQGALIEDLVDELSAKVEFLLQTYNLYGPEGFTFPDGDHWTTAAQREREG